VRKPALATVLLATGVLAAACVSHKTGGIGKAAATTRTPQSLKSHGVNEAGKSSTQILADAKRVALAARSVHVAGDAGGGVTIDMVLTSNGQVEGAFNPPGKAMQVVVLDPTTAYAKTDKTGGRYVRLPQANAEQISKTFSMHNLISDALTPVGTASKSGVTKQGGQDQIGLKDSSDGSMLYVADSSGAPYPLRITQSGGGGVVFNNWNKTVTVSVPGGTT
jgi:hypothetical protein